MTVVHEGRENDMAIRIGARESQRGMAADVRQLITDRTDDAGSDERPC